MAPHDPTAPDEAGPGVPTPPIPLALPLAPAGHLSPDAVPLPDALVERLRATGAGVSIDVDDRVEASRDWWPLAMTWADHGEVAAVAGAVVRPTGPEQVASVLRACNEARVPVTAAGGRSGVEGGSVPLFGGVVLDLCGLAGVRSVDRTDLVVDVGAGTFGDRLEAELRATHSLTVGHWPQSMTLSTVGGWLACRGAGQLSNRYGKVEDLVLGLDVVLADGTELHTGGHERQAVGPDLTQLFVGSEGTLGVITGARLRAWPVPEGRHVAAYAFSDFASGADACRRIVQRGLSPAALRLYDSVEGDRSYGTGDKTLLLVFDEGDPLVVDAARAITADACLAAEELDPGLVEQWLEHRNDVSALQAFVSAGYVVDTMELTTSWSSLPKVYAEVRAAIAAVPGVVASSAHLSHSYPGGACLYFTFGGQPDDDRAAARDDFYLACWDAGTSTALGLGAALSHHHGVGINRARFVAEALGSEAAAVLAGLKHTLDPNGVLNPGKLGLPSSFGPVPFPRKGEPVNQYDRQAILAGAISGLFFALPAAVLQRTLFDDTAVAGLMLAVVIFAGLLAGYAAARPGPPRPLMHGALAGAVTFIGPEIVYVVAAREVPHPVALVFGLLMFSSLGAIGAYVAVWRGANGASPERGR